MKTVVVATEFDAPAAVVWAAVKTPHAFVHIAKGTLRYPPAERLNRPWRVGDDLKGWMFLLGLIPLSKHRITIESIDDEKRVLSSDEGGGVVRTWRHQLITTPLDDNRCRYEDRIEIDAGVLTPVVAGFAALFYRHRQRRWKSLARLLAASAKAAATS